MQFQRKNRRDVLPVWGHGGTCSSPSRHSAAYCACKRDTAAENVSLMHPPLRMICTIVCGIMEWFKHFSVIRERHVTFLEEHETQGTQLAVPENIVDVFSFLRSIPCVSFASEVKIVTLSFAIFVSSVSNSIVWTLIDANFPQRSLYPSLFGMPNLVEE